MWSFIKRLVSGRYQPLLVLLVMVGFATVLTLPQLWDKGAVVGADFLFHYNRFYEAAMQIKEGNWSYFISIYGFQESGRIINALYGPAFAYLQGLIVLLSGTWFRYQIVSKILLGTLASLSMSALLKTAGVRLRFRLPLSLLFMTTASIQYWWMVQGFSSWGAALFPLCFIPAVKVLQTGNINRWELGGAVALMAQVHVLSTLFLVITYVPCFLYAWLISNKKWNFVREGLLAVGICGLLTLNVSLPLAELSVTNELKAPFVNQHLAQESVTWWKWTYLITPLPLLAILLGHLGTYVGSLKKITPSLHVLTGLYLTFLWLSTNLFPWQLLVGKGVGLVDLIQFPFRFFFYATPLLLLLTGVALARSAEKWQKPLMTFFAFSLILAGAQVMYETKKVTTAYYQGIYPEERHTTKYGTDAEIKEAFHDKDLSRLIYLAQKSTPDYVPKQSLKKTTTVPNPEKKTYYNLYTDYIILNNESVAKERRGNQLVLRWESQVDEEKALPIVSYHRSQMTLDGEKVAKDKIRYTALGSPLIPVTAGYHELTLSYESPSWLLPVLWGTVGSWCVYLVILFKRNKSDVKGGEVL